MIVCIFFSSNVHIVQYKGNNNIITKYKNDYNIIHSNTQDLILFDFMKIFTKSEEKKVSHKIIFSTHFNYMINFSKF